MGPQKRKVAAVIQTSIDDSEVRIVRRLRQAYGMNAASLVRALLREKYAEYYGMLPDLGNPEGKDEER